MQGRALPAEQVLLLLRKQAGELCCQYLEYLVVGRGSQVPEHHTELALSFASAALALMPPVDERCERLCLCCTATASTQHQQAALMKCQWDCSGTSTVHLSPGERSESSGRPAFVLSVSECWTKGIDSRLHVQCAGLGARAGGKGAYVRGYRMGAAPAAPS